MQLVRLHAAGRLVALHRVRMYVRALVYPGTRPRTIVDKYRVAIPREPVDAPSPRTKRRADAHTEAERDCASDKESRTGGIENHRGIVVRHIDEARIRG